MLTLREAFSFWCTFLLFLPTGLGVSGSRRKVHAIVLKRKREREESRTRVESAALFCSFTVSGQRRI